MLSKWCSYLLAFCFFHRVLAQGVAQPEPKTTEYATNNTEIWANYMVELYQKDGSFWFSETNLRHSFFPYSPNLGGLPLYNIQQKIGYEKYIDKNWSVGISMRGVLEKQEKQLFTQIYVSHVSAISRHTVELMKYLSFERIDSDNVLKKTESRLTIGMALAKTFKIKNSPRLRPILAYDVFMMHTWLLNSHPLYNRRAVDKSRFRIELAYFLRKNLTIAAYYIDQTDFFVAEPTYTAKGEETSPLRNLNITTPIVGFRIHWLLFNAQKPETIRLRFFPY